MAMLDKLRIRGIRNFGINDEDEQEITFTAPVTFIVGGNGTGKTTILEAIKYALIGEMPPNCKTGVGFVTDPNTLDLNETIGKVKLTVKDANGEEIVISRKRRVYKDASGTDLASESVESSVSRYKNGIQQPISRRVLGATGDVCSIMDVSKPIIDHVLFCHQENASWPIDGDSKVKKIFDKIFETKKYNEALAKMRTILRECKAEIGQKELNLERKKMYKDEAVKKQENLTQNEEQLRSFQTECTECIAQLNPLNEQIKNIEERINNFSSTLTEIKVVETELRSEKYAEQKYLSSIEEEFEGTKEQLEKEIESLKGKCSQNQLKLTALENKLKDDRISCNQIKSKIEEKDRTFQNVNQSYDLNTYLCNEIDHYKVILQVDFNIMLDEGFNSQDDSIRRVQHKLQSDVTEITNKIEQTDAEYEQKLQKQYESIALTNFEIKSIDKQLMNLREELFKQNNELESFEESEQSLVDIQRKIEENNTEVARLLVLCDSLDGEITKIHENRKKFTNELEEIYEKIYSAANNCSTSDGEKSPKKRDDLTSLDSLHKRRKVLMEHIETLNIENIIKTYQKNMKTIFGLQKWEIELKNAEFILMKYSSLMVRAQELSEQINKMENEKKTNEQSIGSIEANIKQMKSERVESRRRGTEERDAAIKRVMELEITIKFIDRVWMEKLSHENLIIDINQLKNELAQLREEELTQNKKIQSNEDEIQNLKITISNQREKTVDLSKNIELKDIQNRIKKTKEKLETLKQEEQATDLRKIEAERQNLLSNQNNLKESWNQTMGRITEKGALIEQLEAELDEPKYRDSERNCYTAEYELIVQQKGANDIDIFCKDFEKAIDQFHIKSMEKINHSIKDYWRIVYKGNDIDYIEIKVDEVKQKENSGRRVISYKVIASKNGYMMDFHGQCSAGQRVLASLIIRMALADTFGGNCGIFALDEPTTNLDKENIESLCEALKQIVEERRSQSNFMLLIITHDNEFIRSMDIGSSCWRIERDAITKKSLIKDNDEIENLTEEEETA